MDDGQNQPCTVVAKHVDQCPQCQRRLLCSPSEKLMIKSIHVLELFVYIFTIAALVIVINNVLIS